MSATRCLMGDVLARYRRMRAMRSFTRWVKDAFRNTGRECGHGERPSGRMDLGQYIATTACSNDDFALDWSRELATCDQALRHEQALFLDLLFRGRAGLSQKRGQLGPGRHERPLLANETGDRRLRMALRGTRSSSASSTSEWFPEDHRFAELLDECPGLDRWRKRSPAMQENWIGQPRHAVPASASRRRSATMTVFGVFTTRPDTIFGSSSWRSRPTTRSPPGSPDGGRLHRPEGAKGGTTAKPSSGSAEKKGLRHRAGGPPPARSRLSPAHFIANFVRWILWDGHFRRSGPRPARFRIRLALRPADPPRRRRLGSGRRLQPVEERGRYRHEGVIVNSRFLDGLSVEEVRRGHRRAEAEGWGEGTIVWQLRDWGVAPALLGHTPVRSSTARPAARCRCRATSSVTLPGDVAFDLPNRSAGAPPGLEACRLPGLRRRGIAAKLTRSTPSSIPLVFHPASPASPATGLRSRRLASTGCRWTNI